MYLPGQIVFNLDTRKPVAIGDDVWDKASYPKARHTHFIKPTGRFWQNIAEYKIACPRTIKEAVKALKLNEITPAPTGSMKEALEQPTIDLNRVRHKLIQVLRAYPETDLSKW